MEPNGSNILRYLGYKVGILLNRAKLNVSTAGERPVNINDTIKELNRLGFECRVGYCQTTIKITTGKTFFALIDRINLKIAKAIFSNYYGSPDFVLIAKKAIETQH